LKPASKGRSQTLQGERRSPLARRSNEEKSQEGEPTKNESGADFLFRLRRERPDPTEKEESSVNSTKLFGFESA